MRHRTNMAERIIKGYNRLFEVRLLHHYWLDEGTTVFDLIPDQAKKDARLLQYDVRSLLTVAPTAATTKTLSGFGGLYKITALGCIVAVPGEAIIPADALLEFVVTVQNAAVFNYTALTLRPQQIYEFYHQLDNTIYRYKENVPVLSNLTGAARGTGSNKALFLSTEIPALAPDDRVESLVRSGNALLQLTGDQPGASIQQLNAIAMNLPVFVHQGDVPVIIPPPGLIGAPARGVKLSRDIADNVFVLIRLSAVRVDDSDFNFIDLDGHAKTPHPVFQVRFKNRSTIRQYFNKNTGSVTSTESHP